MARLKYCCCTDLWSIESAAQNLWLNIPPVFLEKNKQT